MIQNLYKEKLLYYINKKQKMVNYNNGKIYKIEDLAGEMCYIGSTTKERLCQRMVQHRSRYTAWKAAKGDKYTVFDIFEKYGIDNCRIVLVETYPCESKDELTSREAHYIRNLACVNKCIPGRTDDQYYQDNIDQILLKQKKHYNENKEKIKEKVKEYYQDNKPTIKAYKAISYTCVCGSHYTNSTKARHMKTKHHIDYIANNPPENINI